MKHYLSVLAIFKNESHIMKEWIEHYIAEGVDHFYLINNFSTDDFMSILQDYRYCITCMHSNIPNIDLKDPQGVNYNAAFENHIDTEWLIVVDLDEFMYSKKHTLRNDIQAIHHSKPEIACLRIGWKIYGSNGLLQQPKSVVKNFTKRCTNTQGLVKNIFKTDAILSFDLHKVELKEGFVALNIPFIQDTNFSLFMLEETVINAPIQLNHYRLQSKEYWNKKINRGDLDSKNQEVYLNVDFFQAFDEISNIIEDTELYQKQKTLYDLIDL